MGQSPVEQSFPGLEMQATLLLWWGLLLSSRGNNFSTFFFVDHFHSPDFWVSCEQVTLNRKQLPVFGEEEMLSQVEMSYVDISLDISLRGEQNQALGLAPSHRPHWYVFR